jgi:hypothetical protein
VIENYLLQRKRGPEHCKTKRGSWGAFISFMHITGEQASAEKKTVSYSLWFITLALQPEKICEVFLKTSIPVS